MVVRALSDGRIGGWLVGGLVEQSSAPAVELVGSYANAIDKNGW